MMMELLEALSGVSIPLWFLCERFFFEMFWSLLAH